MKLKDYNNQLTEGKIWQILRAFVTGKAKIDPDSEYGDAINQIEKIMKKKAPGQNQTYAEIMAADLKSKGFDVSKLGY